MASITEEMRFRQRLCEYAIKYGVTKAARKYHTNRQFVYRQLKKYDGSVRRLALKSRKPHCSPKAHTEDELALIKRMLKRNGIYGLAEVYVRCLRLHQKLRQHVSADTQERLQKAYNTQEELYQLQKNGRRIPGA